jgi:leukotriene-A4 hydrolase
MTEALIGDQAILEAIEDYGIHSPFTQINPGPYNGGNPDNSEGRIPYEKAFQFLYHVEGIMGEWIFQDFLRRYLTANSQLSIFDFEMLDQLYNYLVETQGQEEADRQWTLIDKNTWLYTTGFPPEKANFETDDSRAAIKMAQDLLKDGKWSDEAVKSYKSSWYTNKQTLTLDYLINNKANVT